MLGPLPMAQDHSHLTEVSRPVYSNALTGCHGASALVPTLQKSQAAAGSMGSF